MAKELSIVNTYGNVDIRDGLPRSYVHIRGKRLSQICKKLGVRYAPAVIGIKQSARWFHPIVDGVVVSARAASKVMEAIAAREAKASDPATIAKKLKSQERAAKRKKEEEEQWSMRCSELGIDPDGKTARWLRSGDISPDEAELIGFKTKYRHEYSDYDERFNRDEFLKLRAAGYSPTEAAEEMKEMARGLKTEDAIPKTWDEYLPKYGFDSEISKALARTLQSPPHPIWFKTAEIAVRCAGLPLETLTYELIRDCGTSFGLATGDTD